MKIGIDNYSYHRYFGEVYPGQSRLTEQWDLVDFVDHILSSPSLPLVEGMAIETCFLPEDDHTVLRQLSRLPMPLMFSWGHPNGFMDIPLQQALSEIERFLELSLRFNSNVMRITGSSIQYFYEPHSPQIERVKAYLDQALPLTQGYGVRLALENHGDFHLHEFVEIFDHFDSPHLGWALDTGNFLRLNEDPLQVVQHPSTRVFVVHAKDVAPITGFDGDDPLRLGCVPAGLGITEFKPILSALLTQNYRGPILIEISRMHPDYDAAGEIDMISKGLEYLHNLRSQIGENHARQ
jgi:sugar phosphate isomerase/epimerase